MKTAYPVVISKGEKYLIAYVPDFELNTQGTDLPNAIEMARDAIGIMGIDMEDEQEALPEPSDIADVLAAHSDNIVTLVDIDFEEYRRKDEMRTVKKNCTIPSWLNYEAEKADINFSQTLQQALMEKLKIER